MININVRRLESGILDVECDVHFKGSQEELITVQYTIIKSLKRINRDTFLYAMSKFIEEELKDEPSEDLRK